MGPGRAKRDNIDDKLPHPPNFSMYPELPVLNDSQNRLLYEIKKFMPGRKRNKRNIQKRLPVLEASVESISKLSTFVSARSDVLTAGKNQNQVGRIGGIVIETVHR